MMICPLGLRWWCLTPTSEVTFQEHMVHHASDGGDLPVELTGGLRDGSALKGTQNLRDPPTRT